MYASNSTPPLSYFPQTRARTTSPAANKRTACVDSIADAALFFVALADALAEALALVELTVVELAVIEVAGSVDDAADAASSTEEEVVVGIAT